MLRFPENTAGTESIEHFQSKICLSLAKFRVDESKSKPLPLCGLWPGSIRREWPGSGAVRALDNK